MENKFKERTIECGLWTASNSNNNDYIDITIGSVTISLPMGDHVSEGYATEEECWAIAEQMIGYDRVSIGDIDADDYAEDFRDFCNENAHYNDTIHSEHLFIPSGLLYLLRDLNHVTPSQKQRFTSLLQLLVDYCNSNNYRLLRFIQN
jgi:hypothetical protein